MSHPPNVSHLSTERLAALSDESPTATELAHLATCADCARERAVYQNLLELASAESARLGAPLTQWEALAPALAADGVIDNGRALPTLSRRSRLRGSWLQAAAAVLLVAGGVMGGRYTAGATVLPVGNATNRTAAVDSVPHFASLEEARAAQAQSQLMFQTATAFLAQQDTTNGISESPATIRTRLATLDRVREVVGKALNDAPYDPVINGYYLTTVGQQEATLRQLNTALPAGMRLTSY
ncbi:MAG TPA: hypothetical protein VKP00_00635 [Gemmatimonadaceae bacterium]|nr:hypothetical protein [Gemmatimonadaceae bacterium]